MGWITVGNLATHRLLDVLVPARSKVQPSFGSSDFDVQVSEVCDYACRRIYFFDFVSSRPCFDEGSEESSRPRAHPPPLSFHLLRRSPPSPPTFPLSIFIASDLLELADVHRCYHFVVCSEEEPLVPLILVRPFSFSFSLSHRLTSVSFASRI